MKRMLPAIMAAMLLISLFVPVADAETAVRENTPQFALSAEAETDWLTGGGTDPARAAGRTVKLRRGQTLKLWVYPFASTTQFYKDCGKEVPVGAILFSGTSGKVKARVTAGSSWLKAKKTSSGWSFYVTGRNLALKDKKGAIQVSDRKGAFATILVTRGGTVQYSSIYSRGASIYATISPNADHGNMYVYRWIFDDSGELVGKKKLKVTGTSFRDTVQSTHLFYTYVYTIGYYAEATGKGMQTGAAGVWLVDPLDNAGRVKKATNPEQCISAKWLFRVAH